MRYDPVTCSWKTCQALFEQDYPLSSMTLPNSGLMRNGVCTPRPTLVPLTDGNDSGLWPTATGMDSRASGGNPTTTGTHGTTLTDRAVRMWGTPVARDDQKSPEAHMAMKARMDRNTATSMNENRTTKDALSHGTTHGRTLAGTASHHAPTTSTGGPNGMVLNPAFVAALMGLPTGWLTPSTSAETDSSPSAPEKPGCSSPQGSR